MPRVLSGRCFALPPMRHPMNDFLPFREDRVPEQHYQPG